ncbi:MAG: universal stress protein [Pseudomonadota bacterium]|nr:universal stress protein [Pseudomonadota bacterium]
MTVRVLVPVDDSIGSLRTLKYINKMKDQIPMTVTLLMVVPLSQLEYHGFQQTQIEAITEQSITHCEKIVERHRQVLDKAGVLADVRVEQGNPAAVICRTATSEAFELVLISPNGAGKISNLMFGSVANKVVQECRVPVLLIR